jgi:hypothetical protein
MSVVVVLAMVVLVSVLMRQLLPLLGCMHAPFLKTPAMVLPCFLPALRASRWLLLLLVVAHGSL